MIKKRDLQWSNDYDFIPLVGRYYILVVAGTTLFRGKNYHNYVLGLKFHYLLYKRESVTKNKHESYLKK